MKKIFTLMYLLNKFYSLLFHSKPIPQKQKAIHLLNEIFSVNFETTLGLLRHNKTELPW